MQMPFGVRYAYGLLTRAEILATRSVNPVTGESSYRKD